MRTEPLDDSSATIELRKLRNHYVTSVNSERLELAMQGGALHPHELGGARNVAAETTDLSNQIFALEHFTRLAQWQPHQLLSAIAVRHRRHHGADILRQHRGSNHRLRIATGKNHQAFDVVAELTDVAGPVV